jgi:hypothetical protein
MRKISARRVGVWAGGTNEHDDLGGQVDAFRRQRQGFGNPASGVFENGAEGPYLMGCLAGGIQKGFARRQ